MPNLHVVADALGLAIESTEFRWETHATPEELDTALGPVEAGTIGEGGGIAYRIDGRPSFKVDVQAVQRSGDDHRAPMAMTALHVINAIPAVTAAAPGHMTPLDLPLYTARGAIRSGQHPASRRP